MFAAPAPPTGPTLTEDRLCRHCGYNLRSQPESGKCPECATPVALSIRANLLRLADPAWVRVLALGASMVGYAIVGSLLAMILLLIALTSGSPFFSWMYLFWPVAGLAMLAGQWLVTRRDPSAPPEESRTATRLVVRIILLVTVGLLFVLSTIQLVALGPLGPITQMLTGLLWIALTVVWVLIYFRHLSDLCERIPDPQLGRLSRRISWLVAGLLLLTSALDLIFGPSQMATPTNAIQFFKLVSSILGLALFICFLRAVELHLKIAKRLRQEAVYAQRNWADHAPPNSSAPQSTIP